MQHYGIIIRIHWIVLYSYDVKQFKNLTVMIAYLMPYVLLGGTWIDDNVEDMRYEWNYIPHSTYIIYTRIYMVYRDSMKYNSKQTLINRFHISIKVNKYMRATNRVI